MRTAAAALGAPLLFLALAVPGWSRTHATPTPAPTPTPVADPAITKIARQQFVQWQAGEVNKSLYIPEVVPKLTDQVISDASQKLGQLGPLVDVVYEGRWINPNFPPGVNGYIYEMLCASGKVYLWLAVDAHGKISVSFKNRFDVETVTPSPSATPTGE